jgi:hypothetical protein
VAYFVTRGYAAEDPLVKEFGGSCSTWNTHRIHLRDVTRVI